MTYQMIWPKVFDSKNLEDRSEPELAAGGLEAWAICKSGKEFNPNGPHPNFGEVMAEIGKRLGIVPLPENLMDWTDKWMAENPSLLLAKNLNSK